MGKLLYIANTSLDGYIEGPDGGISWGEPDEEYFGHINSLQRGVGTYLYGRRMYEAMVYWETAPVAEVPPWIAEFTTMWRRADKIVFSRTLTSASNGRTTLVHDLDIESVRKLKAAEPRDLTVGGAGLATQAFEAGLVDECHLFFWPVALGGGKHTFPRHARLDLELLDEQRLRSGIVHLLYGIKR